MQAGTRTARIYLNRQGRIGWVAIPAPRPSLGAVLVGSKLVDAHDLRAVLCECQRTGKNFADTLVDNDLIAPETMQLQFERYFSDCLNVIASWPAIELMHVPTNLSSTSRFSCDLDAAILQAADDTTTQDSGTNAPPRLKLVAKTPSKKENNMVRVAKLNEAIDLAKNNLGSGLLATDVFSTSDGQSLAGYNSQPRACALFAGITSNLQKTLGGANFPLLSRYYILDLEDDKLVVVALLGEYSWGIMVDQKQVKLGLLLNIVVPDCLALLEAAFAAPAAPVATAVPVPPPVVRHPSH